MKALVVLFVSVVAFLLGSCAEGPLMSDEEYNARKGPAPNQPDFTANLPNQNTSSRPSGY
jgi:hypothetical protein